MSMIEILDELPRLGTEEREAILLRLIEIDRTTGSEETPEMLAAIDAGLRSMEIDQGVPIEDVRRRIDGWISK